MIDLYQSVLNVRQTKLNSIKSKQTIALLDLSRFMPTETSFKNILKRLGDLCNLLAGKLFESRVASYK